jgi:hypothetical protein
VVVAQKLVEFISGRVGVLSLLGIALGIVACASQTGDNMIFFKVEYMHIYNFD